MFMAKIKKNIRNPTINEGYSSILLPQHYLYKGLSWIPTRKRLILSSSVVLIILSFNHF